MNTLSALDGLASYWNTTGLGTPLVTGLIEKWTLLYVNSFTKGLKKTMPAIIKHSPMERTSATTFRAEVFRVVGVGFSPMYSNELTKDLQLGKWANLASASRVLKFGELS